MFLCGTFSRLTSFLSRAGLFIFLLVYKIELLDCSWISWKMWLLDFFHILKPFSWGVSFITSFFPSVPNSFQTVLLEEEQVPDSDCPLALEDTQRCVLNSWKPPCWREDLTLPQLCLSCLSLSGGTGLCYGAHAHVWPSHTWWDTWNFCLVVHFVSDRPGCYWSSIGQNISYKELFFFHFSNPK